MISAEIDGKKNYLSIGIWFWVDGIFLYEK